MPQTAGYSFRHDKSLESPDHAYYNYISGRWLYNEAKRLAERKHKFDVRALCEASAKASNHSVEQVTLFRKVAEGGSYRVFEITFESSQQVIARVPYPCTLPTSFGVASEVATIAFLRSHGLPVPRVLAWSATKTNAIGSEYILMEKCSETSLDETWYSMDHDARKTMVENVVEFETQLHSLEIPAYGSIYFKTWLHPSMKSIELQSGDVHHVDSSFCIGPSAELLWWYLGRDGLDLPRGPWMQAEELMADTAKRELAWLQKFGAPRLPREPIYRSINKHKLANPHEQMRNLKDYISISKLLVPTDNNLCRPMLRHPDLSPNNIFIDALNNITGVIDWQHTIALPRFLHAKMPKHFQNFGDKSSEAFQRPELPADFDTLEGDERVIAEDLYRRQQLHYYYLGFTHRNDESLFRGMLSTDGVLKNRLFEAAGRPWEGDNVSLKAELIRAMANWSSLRPQDSDKAAAPLQYAQSEIDECLELDERQQQGDQQMSSFRDHLGINMDGWVQHDLYESAVSKAEALKDSMLELADNDADREDVIQNWPFQDHEEID